MIVITAGYYLKLTYHLTDVLNYVGQHPNSFAAIPATDYSIGMVYYMRGRYDPAVEAFNQLLTDYPTSQFTEDALLRLGESYQTLRNWPRARAVYQQYMEQFPHAKTYPTVQREYERIKFN
jgi:TolA-binding protein